MLKIPGEVLRLSGLGESFQRMFGTTEVVLRTANIDAEVQVQHWTSTAPMFSESHGKRYSQEGEMLVS